MNCSLARFSAWSLWSPVKGSLGVAAFHLHETQVATDHAHGFPVGHIGERAVHQCIFAGDLNRVQAVQHAAGAGGLAHKAGLVHEGTGDGFYARVGPGAPLPVADREGVFHVGRASADAGGAVRAPEVVVAHGSLDVLGQLQEGLLVSQHVALGAADDDALQVLRAGNSARAMAAMGAGALGHRGGVPDLVLTALADQPDMCQALFAESPRAWAGA